MDFKCIEIGCDKSYKYAEAKKHIFSHMSNLKKCILNCGNETLFKGYEEMKNIYKYAIDNKMRFFSYGDAMMIERKTSK